MQSLAAKQHAAELNQLIIWSGVALTLMAVVSLGTGWFVAGRVLSPLRAMTANVREISATNLHRHLALTGPDDELNDLGKTFNELLGRLDRTFEAQRQFVANASHELRTPLARQRTLLQVALADPDVTVDTLRATAERVLVAGGQQETLIEALFTLAKSERGLERREKVDLAAVVVDVLHLHHEELEGHRVKVETHLEPAPFLGDRGLVERLVTNLVDNAARYNLSPGWIEVSTARTAGSAVLLVTNSGPVVAPGDVDRLFEPFQRSGTDRTFRGEGWGLGLSIVRAVAGGHDATVAARARAHGGLEIEVRFPAGA
jgi:signal transduction histidine kinase